MVADATSGQPFDQIAFNAAIVSIRTSIGITILQRVVCLVKSMQNLLSLVRIKVIVMRHCYTLQC